MCDDTDLLMVVFRGTVLVIAALAGTLCIYLGWRLYRDAVISATKGELKTGAISMSLSAASPGVFLVAFGMWLLVTLVNREVLLESTHEAVEQRPVPSKPIPPATPNKSGFFFSESFAAEAQQGSADNTQCLVKRKETRRLFGGDERGLTNERLRRVLGFTIEGVKRAGVNGISDDKARAEALGTLEELRELVND